MTRIGNYMISTVSGHRPMFKASNQIHSNTLTHSAPEHVTITRHDMRGTGHILMKIHSSPASIVDTISSDLLILLSFSTRCLETSRLPLDSA